MDGLDRLIEMLEGRFGKFWANALLLVAVLGAAAWGIHTFAVDFLLPASGVAVRVFGYIAGLHLALPSSYEAAILLLAGTFQTVIPLGLLIYILVSLRKTKSVLIGDADAIDAEFKSLRQLADEAYEHEKQLIQMIATLQAENEQLKMRLPTE